MITSFHHSRSDFRIFWNVDNVIDFLVRDYDRKTLTVGEDDVFSIVVTHPKSGNVLAQTELQVVDASIGHLRYIVSATDSLDFPIGTLRYSVLVSRNETTTLLFTDRDYSPQSTLEVKYGPLPATVTPAAFGMNAFTTIDGGLRAGAFEGPSILTDASHMRTFLVSTTDFTGQLVFEASVLETVPNSPSGWFAAHTEDFDDASGVRTVNIEGNYSWLRLHLLASSGVIDEVLLK